MDFDGSAQTGTTATTPPDTTTNNNIHNNAIVSAKAPDHVSPKKSPAAPAAAQQREQGVFYDKRESVLSRLNAANAAGSSGRKTKVPFSWYVPIPTSSTREPEVKIEAEGNEQQLAKIDSSPVFNPRSSPTPSAGSSSGGGDGGKAAPDSKALQSATSPRQATTTTGGESQPQVQRTPLILQQLLRDKNEVAREEATDLAHKIVQLLPVENWRDARLKVLHNIGNGFRNLTKVDLLRSLDHFNSPGLNIELSFTELEAALRLLQGSTNLRELTLDNLAFFRPWMAVVGTGAGCILLAEVLRSIKTLEVLSVENVQMRAAGLVHIAAALAANGPSTLQRLNLSRNPIGDEEGARHVGVILTAARNLRALDLKYISMDEGGAKQLGEAVARHQALEELCVSLEQRRRADEAAAFPWGVAGLGCDLSLKPGSLDRFLTAAFTGLHPNTSVQKLVGVYGGGTSTLGVLPQMLRDNPSLRELQLLNPDSLVFRVPSDDWKDLFSSLQVNTSLQSLKLTNVYFLYSTKLYFNYAVVQMEDRVKKGVGLDIDAFAQLVDLLKTRTSLTRFHLECTGYSWTAAWPTFYRALKRNSTLKSLTLYGDVVPLEAGSAVLEWIQASTPLEELDFGDTSQWRSRDELRFWWKDFFRSLRDNTSLKRLRLGSDCFWDDEAFRELMAVLQVNSTLQEIEFSGREPEGKAALVREALRRKSRQETYLAELRKGLARTAWTYPKCGRVFLCGFPEAGKTRLGHCMLQVTQEKSMVQKLKDKFMPRTQGIDIHVLRNDRAMQVSIWDLAGQDIFRALQEYLFPKLNRACVFLFVFSLFNRKSKTVKPQLEEAFRQEFLSWLRFITSNSEVTGLNLPRVVVVLTHKDKVRGAEPKWAERILFKLRKEFEDVVHISPILFYINGRRKEDAQPIVDHVYRSFQELFKEKLFRVPDACCQMSNFLVNWASSNKLQPIVSFQKFAVLCEEAHSDLRNLRHYLQEEERERVLRAVASYLHDVGTVIHFPKSNLMVVNPNWLTNVFLGRLISIGQNFEQPPGRRIASSKHGFLIREDFEKLLQEDFLTPLEKEGYTGLDLQTLQDLMENLDLCYQVSSGDDSSFFVPTIFKTQGEHQLRWLRTKPVQDVSYLGLRVRCKDRQRTALTTAFFSRFQVTLRRTLMQRLALSEQQFMCEYNLISLLVDGHDILVENDEEGDHMDVLVRSIKSRHNSWEFVSKKIVEELRDFCASPRGSPGLELVVDILRTDCARGLVSSAHRRHDQAVSRSELKDKLKQSIDKPVDILRVGDLYAHTWPAVPDAGLQIASEWAVDLLPPQDIVEVREWVQKETKAITERMVKVAEVLEEITGVPKNRAQAKLERSKTDLGLGPDRSKASIKPEAGDAPAKKLTTFDELRAEIKELKSIQQSLRETLTAISLGLDGTVGVPESYLLSELPRRPFFIPGDLCHRISGLVMVGKPMKLHLMCEERTANHMVPNQPGFQLTVAGENQAWLRLVAVNAVKAIWYFLKAGIQVTTAGGVVPELQTADGPYIPLAMMSMAGVLDTLQIDHKASTVTGDSVLDSLLADDKGRWCSPAEAWDCLEDFLSSELHDQITEFFLLFRARYHKAKDQKSAHAWLCEECLNKGILERRLERA
ncbi:hypothetical protein Mapa_004817 [Marchantia paleacea]|nr:hypothetical protein Mapa_004817 [Marchantia paleacea]